MKKSAVQKASISPREGQTKGKLSPIKNGVSPAFNRKATQVGLGSQFKIMGGDLHYTADSFAFNAITRDKYYDVHGSKRAMPKSESYHPRFQIIEDRVAGPLYGERKAIRRAQQALNKIEKRRQVDF